MHGKWRRAAVAYHIYLWSFKDSSGDGWGDLGGVLEKLDYLNDGTERSLGVDAIWLSPIYASAMADFGYDVTDYRAINPLLGTMEDFDRLVAAAHDRGMRVILDFIPNHTSSSHPWFAEALASKDSPKREWYIWRDPGPGAGPPNNWLSVFGGPAWTLDKTSGQYYLHSFLPEQPDLNWRNPAVEAEMLDIMRFWLERGVDGFRLDAVLHLAKDKLLRSEPPNPYYRPGVEEPHLANLNIYSQSRASVKEILRKLCVAVEPYDAFMLGEAYLETDLMLSLYDACDNRRFAPFNFNLITLPWHAQDWREFIDDFDLNLPAGAVPNYVLGNHDRHRVASRLGPERARMATAVLLTLRGMPFIYYGDELGLTDAEVPPRLIRDPFEKHLPGLGFGRDPARGPMPWDDGPHGGFSKAEPWLPVSSLPGTDVRSEDADPASMLNLVRRLIRYRKDSKALTEGSYRSLDADEHVFAFLRETGGKRVLVTANFSGKDVDANLVFRGRLRHAEGTHWPKREGDLEAKDLVLAPYEAAVFEVI